MTNQYVNKLILGNETLFDISGDTATAADVAQGKTFHLASGAPAVGTASGGGGADVVDVRWWGGIEPELIGETLWSKSPTEAANWPITPSTTNQNLTWTSEYTATANANAIIDRIGKGYHGVTETLDFGTYNYIFIQDAYVHYEYTVDEATMGKAHGVHEGLTRIDHYGSRARMSSGQIVKPSAAVYGSYSSVNCTMPFSLSRSASNTPALNASVTYGISITYQSPSLSSTSKVKPDYFLVKTPTFGIKASTSMPADAFDYLDWDETTLNVRCRIYRVPVEYGLYTQIYDRLLDMIQDEAFPTASDTIWAAKIPSASGVTF